MSVRRAVRGDAAAIAALWRSLFETHAAIDPAFALREGAETKLVIAVLRALDDRGAAVPSGLYFYRLTADGRSETRRMVRIAR